MLEHPSWQVKLTCPIDTKRTIFWNNPQRALHKVHLNSFLPKIPMLLFTTYLRQRRQLVESTHAWDLGIPSNSISKSSSMWMMCSKEQGTIVEVKTSFGYFPKVTLRWFLFTVTWSEIFICQFTNFSPKPHLVDPFTRIQMVSFSCTTPFIPHTIPRLCRCRGLPVTIISNQTIESIVLEVQNQRTLYRYLIAILEDVEPFLRWND